MGMGPGDLFGTVRQAARDWGNTYNVESIKSGKEMGSSIYIVKTENGSMVFTCSEPAIGSAAGVTPLAGPEGKTRSATIHSHGSYLRYYENNSFSPKDKESAHERGVDNYVTTPNGSLKEYNVETEEVTVISTSLPRDPNDPSKPTPVTEPTYPTPEFNDENN